MHNSVLVMGHLLYLAFAAGLLLPQLAYSARPVTDLVHAAMFPKPRPSTFRLQLHSSLPSEYAGCLETYWHTQRLDHFHWASGAPDQTFRQRYFACDKFWSTSDGGERGPIFFYAGNEADVEVYANVTGLMWENAARFGALVLFVEHRYYGETQPCGPDSWKVDPSFLTVEQAMADYARFIWHLKKESPGAHNSPVIAFGGSYGGMLAAWMRMKYPHAVAGAIAASAPIGAFSSVDGWDPAKFWQVVTQDASAQGGAEPDCARNVRLAFYNIQEWGQSAAGRSKLAKLLRLCELPQNETDVENVMYWLQGAFDAYAMGNYPYESSYIGGDAEHPLPAWPMRAACKKISGKLHAHGEALVEGLREAVSVMYNITRDVACYDVSLSGPAAGSSGPWDYQWCTELMAQELPYYPANGRTDMFWDQGPFDMERINDHCQQAWGVTPRPDWIALEFGGLDLSTATNIVFSNGLYDPWSPYGVLSDISDTVVAVLIPEGAHHVDLMFTHPDDPPSVGRARAVEMQHVERWIDQHYQRLAAHGAKRDGSRAEPVDK